MPPYVRVEVNLPVSGPHSSPVLHPQESDSGSTRQHLMSPRYWLASLRCTSRTPLAVLWAVTAFFVVLSFAPSSSARALVPALDRTFPARWWGLSEDGAIPETVGYAVQGITVVLLVALAVRVRRAVFFAWAAVYLVIALDDSLRLHERGSHWLVRHLPEQLASHVSQGRGEQLTWVLLGLLPLVAVAVTHRRAREHRGVSRTIAVLFALLVFFAVVVDEVHENFGYGTLGWVLAAVEDGGELLTLSLTLAFMVGVVRSERPARPI
jgi:hypothetical protein